MSATRQQMSDPATAGWEKLFSIAKKEVDDLQVLKCQLARWCDAQGADAALYTEVGGVSGKLIESGSTRFPAQLTSPSDADSWARIELPEAQLLHTGPTGTNLMDILIATRCATSQA